MLCVCVCARACFIRSILKICTFKECVITYGLCGLGALCTHHYYHYHYIKLWLCAEQLCG